MIPKDDDPEIERSPLSGRIERDGQAISVEIYRISGGNAPWTLEVVDQQCRSTVWDAPFATDQEAYRAFFLSLETHGIASFSSDPPVTD